MVLVDTSLWIAHFRLGEPRLAELLDKGVVLVHPYVIGELACGNLANRAEILSLLQSVPQAPLASHEEALHFIDLRRLMGLGLGYVDVHLLASAFLASSPIWTLDRPLRAAAKKIDIVFDPD